jgi:arginase
MKVRLISVPYDSGRFMAALGLGPVTILKAGLAGRLSANGHDVSGEVIVVADPRPREITTGFAMAAEIARACQRAVAAEQFPLVLAGNCLSAVGVCAGVRADAAVWFDAHGDLNTPDTTVSGMLDGMALATLLGLCWPRQCAAIEGFAPLAAERVVLADARDLDPPEAALIADKGIRHVPVAEAAASAAALAASGAARFYLHLDLDVHDPELATANAFAAAGGPSPQALRAAVARIAADVPLAGAAITAYDPAFDPQGVTAAAAADLAAALVDAIAERRAWQALNSAVRL